MSAEQTPDIADLAAVIGGIDGDSWDDLSPMAQDACLRAAAAVLDSPVLAAAVREAEQRAWERGREDMRRQSVAVMTEGPQLVLRNPYRADCIEVHWGDVDSRPTSLHGNGAKALGRVTLDVAKVTCRLCLALLSDRADRITEPVSHEAATSGEEASKA